MAGAMLVMVVGIALAVAASVGSLMICQNRARSLADLIAFDADQPAIMALVRTGVPDHSRLLYIGGGAVAVLILGGIIAVSVVKKREKAAGDAL